MKLCTKIRLKCLEGVMIKKVVLELESVLGQKKKVIIFAAQSWRGSSAG